MLFWTANSPSYPAKNSSIPPFCLRFKQRLTNISPTIVCSSSGAKVTPSTTAVALDDKRATNLLGFQMLYCSCKSRRRISRYQNFYLPTSFSFSRLFFQAHYKLRFMTTRLLCRSNNTRILVAWFLLNLDKVGVCWPGPPLSHQREGGGIKFPSTPTLTSTTTGSNRSSV